ncbi:MAG: SYNERG-CTERM sorting domain-containing protein [Synergistaceae bacterium]|nr:SYNERG-CTERM sorting domain-containing protein [Synergistaceae bacterium]
MKVTKMLLFVFALLLLVASFAYAGPLDNLKTTWEQSMERATQANRENAGWSPVWSRMERKLFAASASATALPNGYDPRGDILPFVKIVANNSGGRIRYETMGYSLRGVPIPLLIVGFPKAPKNPEEVGERIKIRWQCSIHGGENDGAEASLLFMREVAQGKWDDLLKDVVLFITPAANPDGKNAQTRTFANDSDPNRNWGHAVQPEIRAALKLYRKWDPHVVIDHHNIGAGNLLRHHHIVTYTNGKWGNNDPENDRENTSFAEGLFGDGVGKYKNDDSHYKKFLRKFIDDYSPGTAPAGNNLYSLSDSLTTTSTSSYSPTRNQALSLVSMPYMEGANTQLVSRDSESVWEIIAFPNPGSDSVRSTATYPSAKNRFSILMEIVTYHHTWLKVNAMHASIISTIDLASKRKEDVFAFFKNKDAEYINLNNASYSNPNDPYGHPRLVTVYQGAIDYRNNTGSNTGDGGNAAAPYRKIMPLTGYDHGWGPEIFKLDGHVLTNGSTPDRTRDYTHYPRSILNNIPQWPIKMGAFYVLDPRAKTAVEVLMRDGIPIYKLKEDVTLPAGQTYKVYGIDAGGNKVDNWGVRRNNFFAYNLVRTIKLPRPRVDVIDNYSTEANKISPNFANTLAGQAWVPLTAAQTPSEADAPTHGGGDWFEAPAGYVAKAGHYVIPMAHKWARFAAFKLEPRSNCGLLFWGHYNDIFAAPGETVDQADISNFNLDLVKTFDFTAIPASAIERVAFAEDLNNKPDDVFLPPAIDFPTTGLVNESASVQDAYQCPVSGALKVTIKDACLHDGMWLTFFFFDDFDKNPIPVLMQVFEGDAPGEYKAEFPLDELLAEGLKYGVKYAIQYSNEAGDIFGYGTFTQGEFSIAELKGGDGGGSCPIWGDDDECKGCNAGFAMLAFLALVPFFVMKKR